GVVVRGVLHGNASAKAAVRVEPSATVVGDVSAPRVNIVEGARVRGRVTMTGEPLVPQAVRRRRRGEGSSAGQVAAEPAPAPAAPTPAPAPAAPTPAPAPPAEAREELAPKVRRRRRRGARKPPPPTIPTVQRQKARRKDRAPAEPT
ncbi:MAG: polymer-forming cytoskeletal protein, partial [Sandaracinaceae bacterium]